MRIGIDDTDSPRGGCTTHFALEAAAALREEHGLLLRRLPQLVRLNPNVPWKTRGNAAVALEVGLPSGGPAQNIGASADGRPVVLDPQAGPVRPLQEHLHTLRTLVDRWCDLTRPGTDPAVVIARGPLPAALYEAAVRDVVEPASVREALPRGTLHFALGDGRGIVGAAAAAAFQPGETTFELIAYRQEKAWGTKRRVDWESVEAIDRDFPETFNNLDRENRHIALSPSTPCPVLIGLRARSPERLLKAALRADAGEPWAGYLLFETNQGTDAHVVESSVASARPLTTVSAMAMVASKPRRIAGGHVILEISEPGGATVECAAFEPSKQFRDVVASLEPGDRVRVVGAVKEGGKKLNLEKLEIIDAPPRATSRRKVTCDSCGTALKSSGRKGPLRCPRCGRRAPRGGSKATKPGPAPGWYQPPVSARRHLARPLDRPSIGAPAPNIETQAPPG